MIDTASIRKIVHSDPAEREELLLFLKKHSLGYEDDIDAAYGLFDGDGSLHGCGCAAGSLLKCFAVDESLRGQNALGLLISRLVQNRFSKGIYNLSVITRVKNEPLFTACGFFPVVRTSTLVLLENRPDGPEQFVRPFWESGDEDRRVGAVVMNANPFTLGHRALAEYAAAHCDVLHIFVVEEDRSQFSAGVRLRLVREGIADLSNVRVHPSGRYIISSSTFPTYFLKDGESAAALQCELDITLFAERIAPTLNITQRFAGEEPFDPITACYNSAMARILPAHGIEFMVIPRVAWRDQPVSASRVRALLAKGQYSEAMTLVPNPTQRYISELQEANHESL